MLATGSVANAAFDIPQHVIAGGGGSSSGGSYAITGTIGQSVLGQSSGGSYVVNGGFWGGGTVNGTLAYSGAASRKTHGAVDFDIPIDPSGSMTNGQPITIEPRAIGTGYKIVFLFTAPVSSANAPTTSAGVASAPVFNGNSASVTLTGVTNGSRVQVDLPNVNNSGIGGTARIGFLTGDMNGNRSVQGSDVTFVQQRLGTAVSATTFKADVNANGAIQGSDVTAVQQRLGTTLP